MIVCLNQLTVWIIRRSVITDSHPEKRKGEGIVQNGGRELSCEEEKAEAANKGSWGRGAHPRRRLQPQLSCHQSNPSSGCPPPAIRTMAPLEGRGVGSGE